MKNVTAIFDIGKTHKKLVLFDEDLKSVHEEEHVFEELADEDGFPCDDLDRILSWIRKSLYELLKHEEFEVGLVNFTTYGASWVHIDSRGKPLTSLYNYLKPFPEILKDQFDKTYHLEETLSACASPFEGMLNSGLQLYWLKYQKPEAFQQIHRSLHFPQFLSFALGGKFCAEYTSIGCHTALWDFKKQHYHDWVVKENLLKLFPDISENQWLTEVVLNNKKLQLGMGIHDSSAALLPYIQGSSNTFLLLSTGTWSVALNPFSREPLDFKSHAHGSLCYMQPNGDAVTAAKLFLGHEYDVQEERLAQYFNIGVRQMRHLPFSYAAYQKAKTRNTKVFEFENLDNETYRERSSLEETTDLTEAYHQLVWELVCLQLKSLLLAKGSTQVNTLYIEGGFAKNQVFTHMLANELPALKVLTASNPFGTALGAALVMRKEPLPSGFLQHNYALNEIKPWT